ncbi:hypothetical protein PV08_05333 [Exophiala spinifera]|uniref:Uncharacterized protein n=1 Tax=Exophiala spinifera TaxID=91928 RepID=A0A0D2B8L6_9EURO|nr:uncharacterized protein PV08_05333 [Exophiala spinifera]KIW15288.1 hypothetical protein PV08_05333 [Exophiala spinifera]
MASAASPAPETNFTPFESLSLSLDEDIAQVRAEIEKLTNRRKLLTSSLLSSTKIQNQLSTKPIRRRENNSNPSQFESVFQKSSSNVYRLSFGVTSFPFHDPSPEIQPKNPLLGIRFDICDRNGHFDSPYYLFCIKVGGDEGPSTRELRIHRHTIPALVPLEEYEKQYLPLSDEGYGGSEDSLMSIEETQRKQDLHGLVSRVRHDLVAWRSRLDAIEWVRDKLGISVLKDKRRGPGQEVEHGNDGDTSLLDIDAPAGNFGIREFEAVGVDARQVRILWSDDSVGRIKITDQGKIKKAAVIGFDGHIASVERVLTEGDATVFDLLDRLQEIHASAREGGIR